MKNGKAPFVLGLILMMTAKAHAFETVQVAAAFRFAPEINSAVGSLYDGILFAQEQFQKKNPNVKIELVKYSHTSDNSTIEKVGRQIVADKIKFVLGGEMSEESLVLGDLLKDSGVVFMTPTSSNPRVTEGKPNVFRACFSDEQVATELAKYVFSLKSVHSIGVLNNTVNPYTDFLTNEFMKQIEKARKTGEGPTVTDFRYAGKNPRFDGAVTQFKKANVDMVVAFTLQNDLTSFYQIASKADFFPTYLGSDGWATNEALYQNLVLNQAVKSFKGIRSSYWYQESKSAAVKTFKEDFYKRFGVKPDAWNAIAYDSATILFEAIAKAKDHQDPAQVSQVLKTETFKNLITADTFSFDASNSSKKKLYLYEISKRGIQFLTAME